MQLHARNDVISHYRVLDKLGSGGMGVVYRVKTRAWDAKWHCDPPPEVANDPQMVERLRAKHDLRPL